MFSSEIANTWDSFVSKHIKFPLCPAPLNAPSPTASFRSIRYHTFVEDHDEN